MQPSRCRKFNIPCRQAGRRSPKQHLSSTANANYKNWLYRDANELLTSFVAIFGVVFLNLEVLKRFMLPSQIDFRAFRVFLSSWLVFGRGLLLHLTAQVFCAVSVRFTARHSPIGRSFPFQTQDNALLRHVLPRMLKYLNIYLLFHCKTCLHR